MELQGLSKLLIGTLAAFSTVSLKPLYVVGVVITLLGCGGGGGGSDDDFVGAALIEVRASPNTIDTGDRMEIRTDIEQVHENGILLKFKFPSALEYVPASAELIVDSVSVDATPQINERRESARYLVFFIDEDDLDENGAGQLIFQLAGTARVTDGRLEADADVNDPLVNDNIEFNIESPEFAAEDETSVEVTG